MANELLSCSLSKKKQPPWVYDPAKESKDSAFALALHTPAQSLHHTTRNVPVAPQRLHRLIVVAGAGGLVEQGAPGVLVLQDTSGESPTHRFPFIKNDWIWVIWGSKKIQKETPWWTSPEINSRHDFGRCSMNINRPFHLTARLHKSFKSVISIGPSYLSSNRFQRKGTRIFYRKYHEIPIFHGKTHSFL